MISGSLLLGREEKISALYKNRVVKFSIILFLVSLGYFLYDSVNQGVAFDIKEFMITLYSSIASPQLWYLYKFIAILIVLPLLRKLVKGMERTDYIYYFFCHIVFAGVIPIFQYRISAGGLYINRNFATAFLIETELFYFIMGYFIEHILEKKDFNTKNLCLSIFLMTISIAITYWITLYEGSVRGEFPIGNTEVGYTSILSMMVLSIYFIIKYLFIKLPMPDGKISTFISTVGSCTFGIILLERVIREKTDWILQTLIDQIPTFVAALIWTFICCLIGFMIVWALKKNTLIKNIFSYIESIKGYKGV